MVGTGGRTVVVADDDPTLRLLCRVNLELDGYRVLEAESGAELGRVLDAENHVSALLLDIHLGSDDGVSIARRLRETRPGLRIAFFSGSVDDVAEVSRGLADEFIAKPFSLDDLSAVVRRLVSR